MSRVQRYDTEEIGRLDRAHFVHPWQTLDPSASENALPIVRGEGCFVWDSDGRKYFDAVGGLWCNNIGLGRKEMADAIARQAMELSFASTFVDMTNAPAAHLTGRLAELAPGDLGHVMLCCSGSAAVDSALRLVHFYQSCRGKSEKKHVISRVGSYHGSTYAAMSIGGKQGDRSPLFEYMTDTVHHVSCPDYYRNAKEGMSEAEFLEMLLREFEEKIVELGGSDGVAAYFAEPILGAGGVIVPPGDYNRRMWEICRKYDVLYVSDEVVTAFGRLGHWFASLDEFGVQPDIITSAKGLTSGYVPLGATLFSDEIWRGLSEGGEERCFTQGYTYSGHPVACAAALKNIEIMERENLLDNVKQVGPYFEEQLQSLADLPIVGQVRGRKFMMCVECVADRETKALFPERLDIGKRIANHADARGLIVRPLLHLNVMSPPLTMTKQDVDFVVATLRESIEATMKDLRREGHRAG